MRHTQPTLDKQVREIWLQKTYARVTRSDAKPLKKHDRKPNTTRADALADVEAEAEVLFDVDTFFAEEAEVEYDWAKELLGVWVGAAADNE